MTGTATRTRAKVGSGEVLPKRRRFTAEEYHRMSDLGILGPEERLELFEGEILEMAAIGSRHFACVTLLTERFVIRLAGRAIVSTQNPVRISSCSEPEPDIVLLRPRQDYYAEALPGPGDVLLVIEVADTSLRYDRDHKLPRYAEAGVPEVWIADLKAKRMLVYRDLFENGYRSVQTVARDGSIAPAAFPDLILNLAEIIP